MRRARLPQEALKISIIAGVALAVAIAWGQEQVILRVPQDFPTLEEAITAAPPGATIQIAEGIYRAQLVLEKDLVLEGLSDSVMLRASNPIEPIVRVQGSAHVTLRRIILDDGTRSLIAQDDAAVSLEGSQVRDATLAGILVRDAAHLRCIQSKITENHGRASITAQDQAQLVLDACTVQGNDSEGVFMMGQARLEARRSLFERNRGAALVLIDDAHAVVTASRFTANDGLGVQLRGRSRLSIEESEFFSNIDGRQGQGILAEESAHLEATRVRFLSEKLGIALKDKATASIQECEFVSDSGITVASDGTLITIESNLFRRGKQGVSIASQSAQTKVLVRKNTFEDLIAFLQDSYAVEISGKAAVVVEGNTFERTFVAITMKSAQNATVRDNAFFDNYTAMEITRSHGVIENNRFERNWFGISINSGEVSLHQNLLRETENSAITVRGVAKATIVHTQITEGHGLGILLLEEAQATLQANTLRGGKPHGVVVSGLARVSLQGNRISGYSSCALYLGPKAQLTRDENNDFRNNNGGERCGRVGNSWQDRLEQAPPGAVLEIPPGVYYESLWVNKSLEIRSSGAVFRGNTLDPVIVVTGDATLRLEGVTLQDGIAGIVATDEPPYGDWFPGLITEKGRQQLELYGVKVLANTNAGIWAGSSVTKLVIEKSELRENGRYGIRFHGLSLRFSDGIIAHHETGVFADLAGYQQEPASATIAQTNFAENELGIEVRGGGELTVESSQITQGALGVWIQGTQRTAVRDQILRVRIMRSVVRDHRQERVTSFALALLAIFSGEFLGSGLALEGLADVSIIEDEITENEFHGVAVGQQSSVILERNKIAKNGKYGVALEISACMQGLIVPQRFEGHIAGKHNIVPGPGEPDANLKGAFCPKELEFLKTEQGGSYP